MLNDCINFLISWIFGIFDFMDNWVIIGSVSLLGLIVGFLVLYLVVDNFLPKG